jgi:hypothetical protein
MAEKFAKFRGANVVQVIRIEVNEGSGVPDEDDPITRVVYYVTLDGKVIGHDDSIERKYRGVS